MLKGTKKKSYTREFREAAVRLVTVEKAPTAKAAADFGMPVTELCEGSMTGRCNYP